MSAMKRSFAFTPDYARPPGQLIQEYLETLGISARELARRCGRSPKLITEIVQGKAPIEPETAMQLERVLNLDASIWLGLEADYRLNVARAEEEDNLSLYDEWSKRFPLRTLEQRGFISATTSQVEQVRELLRFFGVGSVAACTARCEDLLSADFRTSPTFLSKVEALAAWLRIGELRASELQMKDFNRSTFVEALKQIRPLTRCPIPTALPLIKDYCAEAGVAFVLEKPIEKVTASGVSRWLSPKRALIQQSFRFRSDDHFWFTFYHEAAHLLLHSRKALYIDLPKGGGNADDEQETEANEWAAEFLVPQGELVKFLTRFRQHRTEEAIISFAQQHGISPGIVVGQLQHRGAIGFNQMNGLRAHYDWCEI
ncbi:MAG TPA: HigA family addiction module antitoxin [Blastocatellia bacterium]|nr:HigA family addiction module antitoxin [Blastocatellia bacterium]